MITKFCHNEECGYVCQADPELDVYAHHDLECPACDRKESLKSEVPKYLIDKLIKKWWINHRKK